MGNEVASFIERIPRHPGRSGADAEDVLSNCRRELGILIGTDDPSRIVLCKNSTEALNIAIHGIGLNNDVVVTTAMEHNSVLRPLYRLEKKSKIKLWIIPCDNEGGVIEKEWYETISKVKPKLVILNHASNVTGAVNPAEKLLSFARENGSITLLDVSQSLGLLNIDASKVGADLIAFTGHKYLLGPSGTGGLYIGEGVDLEPVFVGGTGIRSDLKAMPPELPLRLEPGTPGIPVFAGLEFSLRWQRENPADLQKMLALTNKLEEGLIQCNAAVVKVKGLRTFMVSFCLPNMDLREIGYILDRSFGIICRTGLHCAPLIHNYIGTAPEGSIRLSISRFTTEDDIEYILETIRELVNETG